MLDATASACFRGMVDRQATHQRFTSQTLNLSVSVRRLGPIQPPAGGNVSDTAKAAQLGLIRRLGFGEQTHSRSDDRCLYPLATEATQMCKRATRFYDPGARMGLLLLLNFYPI